MAPKQAAEEETVTLTDADLQWSFVRDDQPRSETCKQIALAIRDEVRDLESAGIRLIQIDEQPRDWVPIWPFEVYPVVSDARGYPSWPGASMLHTRGLIHCCSSHVRPLNIPPCDARPGHANWHEAPVSGNFRTWSLAGGYSCRAH